MLKIDYYNDKLKAAGVKFENGLSSLEIRNIESKYKILFPPDLKEYLSYEMPISNGFINWRGDERKILEALNWPFEGICFDIENNGFWLYEWGEKPIEYKEQIKIAKYNYDKAPKMIPINGHRYIPECPKEVNNPIFSIYQTDIIYYGSNFYNYLLNEFAYYFGQLDHKIEFDSEIKTIRFWTKLVEINS